MNHRAIISDYIENELLDGVDMVDDDDLLLNDGVVDSIGMVRLVGHMEERFKIEIPPEHFTIENFRSINTIVAYLDKLNSNA